MNQQASAVSPAEVLFAGECSSTSGLSNAIDLVNLCPKEFYDQSNPWSHLGGRIFHGLSWVSDLKLRGDDPEIGERQKVCLHSLLSTHGITREERIAVGGWMLSHMLPELERD